MATGTIKDIHLPFRDNWLPAYFRNAHFHVEASSKENGRRVVVHEFPKKELPYAEDMGRRAFEFTVRGYCATYPRTYQGPGQELYNRDYRVARDILLEELQKDSDGVLYVPTLPKMVMRVRCTRYRMTEEEKAGGFCTFDMSFVELGASPFQPIQDAGTALTSSATALVARVVTTLAG